MHRIERIVVHVALLALVVIILADFQGPGRSAIGDEPRPADQLGPADEVLLRGDDGELVLTNTKGRLAFGERPTERIWSIGAVNVSRLLKTLMDADRFGEARTELQEEAAEQDAAYEARFEAFQQENADVNRESPDFPRVQAQFQQMMQEYQTWQQGTMAIRQKLGADHGGQEGEVFHRGAPGSESADGFDRQKAAQEALNGSLRPEWPRSSIDWNLVVNGEHSLAICSKAIYF